MSNNALQQPVQKRLSFDDLQQAGARLTQGKRVQKMNDEALQQHMASTYNNLRMGLAVISFVFPLFLLFVGAYWYGVSSQNSMSAYYWAGANSNGPIRSWLTGVDFFPIKYVLFFLAGVDGDAPMRSWFVGFLFVLGIFLYLYKGFSKGENYLLNVAGLCALGVALFPMQWNCGDSCRSITFHGASAIVLFVCIALVALFCSKQTLLQEPRLGPEKEAYYRRWYHVTGVAMIAFPLVAWVITQVIGNAYFIFVAEWLGIWSFAAYWFIKSRELKENRADIRVLEKNSTLADQPAGGPTEDAAVPAHPGLAVSPDAGSQQ